MFLLLIKILHFLNYSSSVENMLHRAYFHFIRLRDHINTSRVFVHWVIGKYMVQIVRIQL